MLSIRPAKLDDAQAISWFLNEQTYVYRHLDWRTPLDWLGFQPYLLLIDGNKISAVLACPPEPDEAAWVRLFAADPHQNIHKVWRLLLDEAIAKLEHCENKHLVALGLQKWFEDLLIQSEFSSQQSIVVLEWDETIPPARTMPSEVFIRPMTIKDIPIVQYLDELAFSPIWQYSEDALMLAMAQTSISTVAQMGNQVIAYQMSTSYASNGHLARLAVHPQMLRKSIGYNLVRHLLLEFTHRGVRRITVNTQNDNSASLALYQKLGFHLNGDDYKVYEHSMSGQSG